MEHCLCCDKALESEAGGLVTVTMQDGAVRFAHAHCAPACSRCGKPLPVDRAVEDMSADKAVSYGRSEDGTTPVEHEECPR
jgi:hypothetical protein